MSPTRGPDPPMSPPELCPAPHAPSLDDDQLAALRDLVGRPSAIGYEAKPPGTLAPTLPRDTVAHLAGLAALGLVERWTPHPGVACWTLTAWGADALRLVLVEDAAGEPRWAKPGDEPRHAHPARWALRDDPRWIGMLDAGLAEDRRGTDPGAEAIVNECAELIREFEALVETDPDRALASLRRAESIVEGVSGVVRARWLWDEVEGRPRLVMGRLVPRDGRMGGGAGRPG